MLVNDTSTIAPQYYLKCYIGIVFVQTWGRVNAREWTDRTRFSDARPRCTISYATHLHSGGWGRNIISEGSLGDTHTYPIHILLYNIV